ncbi:MAG: hypothetical protein GYB67_10650 [Chloroflexi bacterium]|nr:hypothetical protein [Chloroflexota bacterium]
MNTLRRWQLTPGQPLALQIAADARLSTTDYSDDQVWELLLGAVEAPALVLQTRYGGRAGLASLVPMWTLAGRSVYEYQAYAAPPVISTFAPGYLQAEARITPTLALLAEYWVPDSHAIGGRFTLQNIGDTALSLRLNLIGFVASNNREHRLGSLTLPDDSTGLYMSRVGNLEPAVLLAGGQVIRESDRSKLMIDVTVAPGSATEIRWMHAARPDIDDSVQLAQHWLAADWQTHIAAIVAAAQAIPVVESGDIDADAAIAFACQQLVQSVVGATARLPQASFVATRQPCRGFSPCGDGSDHPRAWSGQNPALAYLTGLGLAAIDPALAQGIVRNYLAIQRDDGWIDGKPGLAGQRQNLMIMPILARLAWGIFQYTEEDTFLRETASGLHRAFARWFASDLDADGDGLPEWQAEQQTEYPFMPTFARGLRWGQQADIRLVEAPDLIAYLLSEAVSLHAIAYYLRDETTALALQSRIESLQSALEALWSDAAQAYGYRDRDTHTRPGHPVVLANGRGDEDHPIALDLAPPSRLLVEINGGGNHVPQMTLHIDGHDAHGAPINERATADQFAWRYGRGVYTTQTAFTQIDRLRAEGLVGVYRIDAATVDLTRRDLTGLLPLWAVNIPAERANVLIAHLTDPDQFWRSNGVTMCSAQDIDFDPANARGAGGVWPFWLTLIAEGLIEAGRVDLATDLLKRLLKTQVAVLKQARAFSEFYHADETQGLGEHGHTAGLVPLHLLLRVLGVRIISARKVWTGGAFTWGAPVAITQHGVSVQRSTDATAITFPSGHRVHLSGTAPWQEIIDPS